MPKSRKNPAIDALEDYYACVTIEIQVYVQAKDREDASNIVESVMDSIKINSSVDCESIDYDGHEITEISLHQ